VKNIFIGFIVLCLLAFIGVAGYLFLPSTKITIEPNIIKNKIDLDLHGNSDIAQVDKSVVPIRVINKDESVSVSYQVSGASSLNAGKKAHGNVVIYNEYDKSPQTLIATTRLESSDGKIFRLVKNVVVPGTTTLAGETKAGVISADVVADQSGADYNVASGNFKIPGFKDGPKYDKFYAKSTEAMTGGSNGENSEVGSGKISQSDIDSAKQKTEAALKEKIADSIRAAMHDGDVFLPQAEKITMTKSSTTAKIGDKVSSFDYVATASFRALVFSENDIRKVMLESLDNKDIKDFKKDITKVEYGTVNADFDGNTLELKVHGEVTAVPIIDSEKIKSELLGKTEGQLEPILKKYSTIRNVNVEFQPTFISRISQYPQRVSVEIQNVEN